MTFSELEKKRIEKVANAYVQKRRPPPHIRPKLDVSFRVSGQSLEIFELRPAWREPGVILEQPVAKATYVKSKQLWKVFWMRQDLRWHTYSPTPTVDSVEEFLELVETDPHACFWG